MSDYERIWLQTTDEHGEATWCQDKINDDDVEYIRADLNATLKRENEQLQDALYHSGYDWTDCIDCGGPPHNEYCRFWKLRHLFPLWFEADSLITDTLDTD